MIQILVRTNNLFFFFEEFIMYKYLYGSIIYGRMKMVGIMI